MITRCIVYMYSDLSLVPTNSIDINHLLAHMQEYRVATAAIDYQFRDDLISPQPPETFTRIKVPLETVRTAPKESQFTVGRPLR